MYNLYTKIVKILEICKKLAMEMDGGEELFCRPKANKSV